MSYVAYCSEAELRKFKPEENTTIITLSDRASEVTTVDRADGNRQIVYPFKVLEPVGREGSFKPMDDQAKALGTYLLGFLKDVNGPIIVQCMYGERRSFAVASGIYFAGTRPVLNTIEQGELIESSDRGGGLFERRTSARLADTLLGDTD